jgi:hypothetical protein
MADLLYGLYIMAGFFDNKSTLDAISRVAVQERVGGASLLTVGKIIGWDKTGGDPMIIPPLRNWP